MAIALSKEQIPADLAATAEEGDKTTAAYATLGGANWIVIALLGSMGATLLSIGPEDPMWREMNTALNGPEGNGPPDAIDKLVTQIAADREGDFIDLGNHGRAMLKLGAGDMVVQQLKALMK